MHIFIGVPASSEDFRVLPCHALDHLHHTSLICTHDAPGGQAPGEIAAMSRLLTHDDAADLPWWMEPTPLLS
jgi:hypothetical protein